MASVVAVWRLRLALVGLLSLVEDSFFLVTLPEERFSILLQPPVISLRWWFDSQFSPRIFLHKFGAELSLSSAAALGSSTTCVGRHLTSLVWGSIHSELKTIAKFRPGCQICWWVVADII